jgi:hypothetical protein
MDRTDILTLVGQKIERVTKDGEFVCLWLGDGRVVQANEAFLFNADGMNFDTRRALTMDRKPLPPPFPILSRVRYVGTRRMSILLPDGGEILLLEPGMEVEITSTHPGRQGTMMPQPGDWDADFQPYDYTEDGHSIYRLDIAETGERYGRIIWPKDAGEWEKV